MTNFFTNDITLAVTLALNGYALHSIKPRVDRPTFADFEFEPVERGFLNDYDMDLIAVEPKSFALKMRSLTGLAQRVCRL